MANQDSFDGYSVPELYAMVSAAVPGSLTAMAAKWNDMAKVDNDVAYEEQSHLNTLSARWQSPQAQPAFVGQVGQLVDTMYALGVSAPNVGSALSGAAGALGTAQVQMDKIYQSYQALFTGPAGNAAAAQAELQALQKQAVQVMTTLAAEYRAQLEAIPATPAYAGPQGVSTNGQPTQQTTATTNTSATQFGNNATTQQGGSQNGVTATNQAANQAATANQATPSLTGTTTPTSLAATATAPASTIGSVGDTGTTIPPIATTPIGSPVSTPTSFTGGVPVLPVTPLPAKSGGVGGGGFGEEVGTGGLPGEVLPVAALPAEALPGGAVADGSTPAEPGLLGAESTAGTGTGMMPFLPGGAGGFAGAEAAAGSRPRRPGGGLFDDEVEPADRRIGAGGVIESEEAGPVLPYGVVGGQHGDRDRKRRPAGAGEAWDDGGAVAPAVLVADPVPHR